MDFVFISSFFMSVLFLSHVSSSFQCVLVLLLFSWVCSPVQFLSHALSLFLLSFSWVFVSGVCLFKFEYLSVYSCGEELLLDLRVPEVGDVERGSPAGVVEDVHLAQGGLRTLRFLLQAGPLPIF